VSRPGLTAAALLLAIAIAFGGCGGGGEPWVEYQSVSPPSGIEPAGERAERQGGPDPDAGEEIFRLRPREGETIGYAVSVRNITDREISVTGVKADEDRDGALVPKSVVGAPVTIAAGERGQVEVEGVVHGCQYGGQTVPLAGPELQMRSGGDERTQEVELDVRVELVVEEGC
jgi:hypothetical protein